MSRSVIHSTTPRPSPHGLERLRPAASVLSMVLVGALALSGCSVKRFVAGQVANSLTEGEDVFASDDDPELVREALPFGLKMMESLLEIVPQHRGLLLTCCRGFTQYTFAFVHMDADMLERTDRARAAIQRGRALKLYMRGQRYGLRALERRHRGIGERLKVKPEKAAAELDQKDLPFAYWTAAAWGSAISVGKDRPELTADVAAVKALMNRALALDEDYEDGIIHEAMIVLEALPAMMGGSNERAREHFRRAVELSNGHRATPYLILAENVSIQEQNRPEFERLLGQALEVDPDRDPSIRLETIMIQRKARFLLEVGDDLFLEPDTSHVEEQR